MVSGISTLKDSIWCWWLNRYSELYSEILNSKNEFAKWWTKNKAEAMYCAKSLTVLSKYCKKKNVINTLYMIYSQSCIEKIFLSICIHVIWVLKVKNCICWHFKASCLYKNVTILSFWCFWYRGLLIGPVKLFYYIKMNNTSVSCILTKKTNSK